VKTYRIGILGYGFIGRVHAWAQQNLRFHYDFPFNTEIVRVATSRSETAQRAALELGCDGTTESTDITTADDIDVVHVCTPNHLHLGALLEAMEAEKHIYCDKPLVVDASEAAEVRRAAGRYLSDAGGAPGATWASDASGSSGATATSGQPVFGVTFNNRFFPATMHARRLVEEGFLGTPLSYRISYLHSGSADPSAPAKWKLRAEAGGGVIRDLASHPLDLITWLLGPYTDMRAVTDIAYPERPDPADPSRARTVDTEDNVIVLGRILPIVSPERRADPIPGILESSKVATGTEDELRFEIHGSLGAVRFNSMDAHHLEIYDRRHTPSSGPAPGGWTRLQTGGRYPAPARAFPSPKAAVGWLRGHLASVAAFMSHVDAGTPADPGLETGLYVQELIDAVDRAAETGETLRLG
jgi:predicted dehydrogenase